MNIAQRIGFDAFWLVWPKCRRVGKKQAMQQWENIPTDLYKTICVAVDRQKKQPSWNKDGGAFIPYPYRWLRDRRWEDEVTVPEDKDVDTLIEAISQYSAMPNDLPPKIAARFRKMCMRLKTNWPEMHIYMARMEEEAEAYIRKEFLATD